MNRTDVSPSAGNQQGNYNKQNISQIPKTYFARAGSDLAGVHWSENRPPSRGVMSCTVQYIVQNIYDHCDIPKSANGKFAQKLDWEDLLAGLLV
jgi:hypothetical protein